MLILCWLCLLLIYLFVIFHTCVLWQYAYNSIERANQRCLFGDLGPFISNLLLKSYILCPFLLVTGEDAMPSNRVKKKCY